MARVGAAYSHRPQQNTYGYLIRPVDSSSPVASGRVGALVAIHQAIAGPAINPVQVFWTWHLFYWVKFTFETCFRGLLFVIRCPSYLVWSKTFLLGIGLTDLSEFGRYLGQNKAIVSVFNGPVIYFNVGVVIIVLARIVVLVTNLILF